MQPGKNEKNPKVPGHSQQAELGQQKPSCLVVVATACLTPPPPTNPHFLNEISDKGRNNSKIVLIERLSAVNASLEGKATSWRQTEVPSGQRGLMASPPTSRGCGFSQADEYAVHSGRKTKQNDSHYFTALAGERTQQDGHGCCPTRPKQPQPRVEQAKRPDVLAFSKEAIMVLEVCGSSGIAKLVLPDLVQDFTDFGTTH